MTGYKVVRLKIVETKPAKNLEEAMDLALHLREIYSCDLILLQTSTKEDKVFFWPANL